MFEGCLILNPRKELVPTEINDPTNAPAGLINLSMLEQLSKEKLGHKAMQPQLFLAFPPLLLFRVILEPEMQAL